MHQVLNEKIPYFSDDGLSCAESTLRYLIEHGYADLPLDTVRIMTGLHGNMGRCANCGAVNGSVAAIGANILKLKPRIDVLNGNMLSTKKYRGRTAKCFAAYADDMLKGKDNIRQNRIFITHSGIDPDIIELMKEKIHEWQPDIENIYVTRAGGTISCHCGPGTLGILYMYE